jgi:hypothetical protein
MKESVRREALSLVAIESTSANQRHLMPILFVPK